MIVCLHTVQVAIYTTIYILYVRIYIIKSTDGDHGHGQSTSPPITVIYYSTVGRSIADSYIRPEARSTEVNMPPRSDIEAIDRPTVLYILHSTISAQQTNLLPENASQTDAIFHQSRYGIIISDHLAILKFLWLRNHRTIYYVYLVTLCACWYVCPPGARSTMFLNKTLAECCATPYSSVSELLQVWL